MDNAKNAIRWREFADSDLRVAAHLSKNMWPIPIEQICYHCQQSAEKYLKAYLILKGQTPPRTHDLKELLRHCETAGGHSLADIVDDCSDLTPYAVLPRYPSDVELEEIDMRLALKCANHIKDFMQSLAPLLFSKP
jgi:HEPN domain-containing protein